MPEGIGYGSPPRLVSVETGFGKGQASAADTLQRQNARQEEVVAKAIEQQSERSGERADRLARQADQVENRSDTRVQLAGLGQRVDISV
ncbi:hypothetical protein [Roseibium sp.]|uniref:hypothetical protein n=1 Tax=Roseibium sp. TaxID=1936156 RepID=UPI003A971DB9